MYDFGVMWVWGSGGDTQRIFCRYGMGMGIEIPSLRQPWQLVRGVGARNHQSISPACRTFSSKPAVAAAAAAVIDGTQRQTDGHLTIK